MPNVGPTVVTVLGAVIGLAMIAVLVSKNAQTPAVITGAGSALSSVINAAVSPVANNAQGSSFGSAGSALSALSNVSF